MAESTTLEIIQGLAQAASNAYDGVHDERFTLDGQVRKVGLRREEGCPLMDSRVNDGFSVKFYGNKICINYQSDIRLKDIYNTKDYEGDIVRQLTEIKKFLQKEYKAITGKSITLTADGEPKVIAQSTSRVRSFVQAYQHYKISGVKEEPIMDPAVEDSRKITRDFLEKFKAAKRPSNDKRKKGDNEKK
tara:strand:+ start:969 stop:1535 length:567 start_codon:yes stop_codon:yes gene_type:complete